MRLFRAIRIFVGFFPLQSFFLVYDGYCSWRFGCVVIVVVASCWLPCIVVGLTRAKIDNYCLHNINISGQGCLCDGCVRACVCACAGVFPVVRSHAATPLLFRSNANCALCLILFVNKIIVFVAKIRRGTQSHFICSFSCFLSVSVRFL